MNETTMVQQDAAIDVNANNTAVPVQPPADPKAAHEAAEAKRRAEWEAEQAAKKEVLEKTLADVGAMSDADVITAAVKRLEDDADRLTQRKMKERIAEHIKNMCRTNHDFARLTMQPQKNTFNCFKFIQRHALEYLKKAKTGTKGGDVPDDLCFKWAEEYYFAADAEEDKGKDDTFTPKKHYGNADKAAHDAAEAKRKAKWDAKQQRKAEADGKVLEEMLAMSDEEVSSAAAEKIDLDIERAFKRHMKIQVSEKLQTACRKDPAFARIIMHPRKNLSNCFKCLQRLAMDYLRDVALANGEDGTFPYGDVPDDMCCEWAVDYFSDPDIEEDIDKDDEFVPKPFYGGSSSSRAKKTAPPKKPDPPANQVDLVL